MALAESIKKGGRYTKKEQEERKLQVYHLHFEKKKHAIEIAQMLEVNRNTINEDIKFWYNQMQNKSNGIDLEAKMRNQIQRMEIQRDRFLEYLEEAKNLEEKIKLERQISELDYRLTQFYSKVLFTGKNGWTSFEEPKDDEEEIKNFVKDLVLKNKNHNARNTYSEESLIFEIVKKTKCSVLESEIMFDNMEDKGLEYCILETGSPSNEKTENQYNLEEFGKLRGYF